MTFIPPRTSSKQLLVGMAVIGMLIAALLFYCSCGATATGITAGALVGAETITDTASTQFPPYDKKHRAVLLERALTRSQALLEKAAWDELAEKIWKIIEGTHESVKLAASALSDVHKGLRNKGEITKWIEPAIKNGLQLKELLESFGVKLDFSKAVK